VFLIAALPVTRASAARQSHRSEPAVNDPVSDQRLERLWARQVRVYERTGRVFEHTAEFSARLQSWIDRAAQNGKDVAALQAALDAFEAAAARAQLSYARARRIVDSHPGFDDHGQVADAGQARATVQQLHEELRSIRSAMGGAGRALRAAIREFRAANRPGASTGEQDS